MVSAWQPAQLWHLVFHLLLQGVSAHTEGQWERISFGRTKLIENSCILLFLWDHDPADRTRSVVPQPDTEQSESRDGLPCTAALVPPCSCSLPPGPCTKMRLHGHGQVAGDEVSPCRKVSHSCRGSGHADTTHGAGAHHAAWRGFSSQS